MSPKLQITPALLDALAKIQEWCGRDYALTPVSNTLTGQLAKLGWVQMHDTKVYAGSGPSRIRRCCITVAGEAALKASR